VTDSVAGAHVCVLRRSDRVCEPSECYNNNSNSNNKNIKTRYFRSWRRGGGGTTALPSPALAGYNIPRTHPASDATTSREKTPKFNLIVCTILVVS